VKDRDMQTLGGDSREATVGVAQYQKSIGPGGYHKFIAAVDNITNGSAEVIAYSIHIDFRVSQFEIPEEDSVQVVVVVLACMGKNSVKVLAALSDDGRKPDDFGTGSYDDEELEPVVVAEFVIGII